MTRPRVRSGQPPEEDHQHGRPAPAPDTDDTRPGDLCPVCPHRWEDHDAIDRRFCSAKIAGGSSQGCVCRKG
ncbi:RGCVC family protein [Pseudonocardia sp. Ae331_Ps2]|uniref:RGCVC family protein n=1 Tax=Pseudonocardia sp. Ae331_Ps2 TaxID=1885031 RepID=UPI0018EA17EF|nr:RGCVC family protein [Pseudonocardia sp. Ae331_Ps2]